VRLTRLEQSVPSPIKMSLENENQQEWKKHISFEFIFTLNLIKALNFDFYLKLMNEQEFIIKAIPQAFC